MPPVRPKLSITLPRNFTFHYTDGQGPKTPERAQEPEEPRQPSPPVYRVRRRARPGLGSISSWDQAYRDPYTTIRPQDVPIPTIEAPEPVANPHPETEGFLPEPVQGYLAPVPSRLRFMSPPKTPLSQILTTYDEAVQTERPDWGHNGEPSPGESISRPASTCSEFSDSSELSDSSSASFHSSTGGSCTSPESDAADPFVFPVVRKGTQKVRRTRTDSGKQLRSEPQRTHKQPHWTSDMDNHIWTTYLIYLQDPTVTPFKMLPGSTPPLGVCHRVAREAKKSWRKSKYNQGMRHAGNTRALRDVQDEQNAVKTADSPDTIKETKSGSTTPTGPDSKKTNCKWPRSESSTRRRLRDLCKSKPSIAPHYQRLLQSRSPSPFHQSRSRSRSRSSHLSSPFGGFKNQPAFSTRDLTFSLTASTSSTMQPDGALAQLARAGSGKQSQQQQTEDWFNKPIDRPQTHQSQPLQFGLGIDGVDGSRDFPRLASPFHDYTQGHNRHLYGSHLRPSPPRTQSDSVTVSGPALRSPVQLQAPLPFLGTQKRRAQHQLEDELSPGGTDMRRDLVEELFGAPAESSHRRVRSRGFSLGDVGAGTRLSSIFTPPTMYDQMNSSEFADTASFETRLMSPSNINRSQRLGSPFAALEPNHPFSTATPKGLPSSSTLPNLSSYIASTASSGEQNSGDLSSSPWN
ncbi:MAG: hypothetical protein M1827_007134 [Pycnora praestabilis]|nr:MAG: hypothetical protein M1827_007134 [Pycnora praestabilis]